MIEWTKKPSAISKAGSAFPTTSAGTFSDAVRTSPLHPRHALLSVHAVLCRVRQCGSSVWISRPREDVVLRFSLGWSHGPQRRFGLAPLHSRMSRPSAFSAVPAAFFPLAAV